MLSKWLEGEDEGGDGEVGVEVWVCDNGGWAADSGVRQRNTRGRSTTCWLVEKEERGWREFGRHSDGTGGESGMLGVEKREEREGREEQCRRKRTREKRMVNGSVKKKRRERKERRFKRVIRN